MKLLLDTHTFLWYIADDPKLPSAARASIHDSSNEVFLSVASIWEAVIKSAIGKLALPSPPEKFLPAQRELHQIASLPIDEGAFLHLGSLKAVHRDPFDRILVAQALQYDLALVTSDEVFQEYPVKLLIT